MVIEGWTKARDVGRAFNQRWPNDSRLLAQ